MAPVATFLCIVFIVWLLRCDARHRPHLSAATWIPTLLLFTAASRSPAQWLGLSAANNPLDQAFSGSLVVASMIILSKRRVPWNRVVAANPALVFFYVYFALTTLWAFYPVDSLVRVVKDFGLTVLPALLLLSDKRPSDAIRAVYVRCACVALPLSLYYTRYGHFGRAYSRGGAMMYTGIATQKNSLGNLVMVFLFFVVWDYLESRSGRRDRLWRRRWWGHLVLLVIGADLLYLSNSANSLVDMVVGLALLAGRRIWMRSPTVRVVVLGVALSVPPLILFTQGFVSDFMPVLDALGRNATLTGRTEIWRSINASTVNPLIGCGFWNFWNSPKGVALSWAMGGEGRLTPNAHNGFLELYLDGGAIGVTVVVVWLLAAARQILRTAYREGFGVVRFVFLVVTLIGNVAEAYLARPSPLWFTTVLVFLNYPFWEAGGSNGRRVIRRVAEIPRALEESGHENIRIGQLRSVSGQ